MSSRDLALDGSEAGTSTPLLSVEELTVEYVTRKATLGRRGERLRAVDGVSFEINERETLGLVGESGSGKSTIGRALVGLERRTHGTVRLRGTEVRPEDRRQLRAIRRRMQMVFQDPAASLNPRMSVGALIAEPLHVHELVKTRQAAAERVARLLDVCGLPRSSVDRFPYSFSGGQQQRIALARALAAEPDLIVADEPTSALDVSIQAQIINLLIELQAEFGLSFLLISHDLGVVRELAQRIVVLYAGRIMEESPRDALYDDPLNPYTEALLSASPIPDPEIERRRHKIVLSGEMPNPIDPPSGCRFHPRCPQVFDPCARAAPPLAPEDGGRRCACWLLAPRGRQGSTLGGER